MKVPSSPSAKFLALLNKQVSKFRKKYKLTEGKAFGMWLAIEYLGLDENDAFEAVSVDGGNDKDIDLFFVDDDMERVVIGQQKFNKKFSASAPNQHPQNPYRRRKLCNH